MAPTAGAITTMSKPREDPGTYDPRTTDPTAVLCVICGRPSHWYEVVNTSEGKKTKRLSSPFRRYRGGYAHEYCIVKARDQDVHV